MRTETVGVRLCCVLFTLFAMVGIGPMTVEAGWVDQITIAAPLNWWRFEETSGTTAADSGSEGSDGEYMGGVELGEPGLVGNAALFDGTGYVLVEQENLEDDWTVEAIFSANVDEGATSQGLIGALTSGADRMAIKAEQWNSLEVIGYTLFGVVDVSFLADTPAELTHIAVVGTLDGVGLYVNGEFIEDQFDTTGLSRHVLAAGLEEGGAVVDPLTGMIDELVVFDRALGDDEIANHFASISEGPAVVLQAGDADQNLEFDQLDLVQVQIAAKYLTGQAATWGEGDWNGAPGGSPGQPPAGDSLFDQLDIIAALNANIYLDGPYGALASAGDGKASITYNPENGEVGVRAGATELTSINIDSAAAIFTGQPAQSLGGSFDNDADSNIFKATFGSSFGSLSFGNVAQAGLSEEFVRNDLSAVGSLLGGGDLGAVDLIYVPEPSTMVLLGLGLFGAIALQQRRRLSSLA